MVFSNVFRKNCHFSLKHTCYGIFELKYNNGFDEFCKFDGFANLMARACQDWHVSDLVPSIIHAAKPENAFSFKVCC